MIRYLITLTLLISVPFVVEAQSVFSEDFSSFQGSGISPNPSSEQLDSNEWSISFESGDAVAFGETATTGTFARGSISSPTVSDEGVYALSDGTTNALWLKKSAGNVYLTLKVTNPLPNTRIDELSLSFDALNFDDSLRSVVFFQLISSDGTNFVATDVTSFDDAPTNTLITQSVSGSLSVNWEPNTDLYFQWLLSHSIGPSGSAYDEVGITNIEITATTTASVDGDPHFSTWGGLRYDYHGQCGLVMVDAPFYNKGMGFRLLVRTKIETWYSFVSNVVIVFGLNVIEITFDNNIFINGEEHNKLPRYFAHHEMTEESGDADEIHHYHRYEVFLNGGEILEIMSLNDVGGKGMLFVNMKKVNFDSSDFAYTNGLMGDFRSGDLVSRDGSKQLLNNMESLVEIVESWQLQNGEDSFFNDTSYSPQYPAKCVLPKADESAEKYIVSDNELVKKAKEVCGRWGHGSANCVYDVTRTGDISYALYGKY